MAISSFCRLLTVFIIVHAAKGPNDFIQTELFSEMKKEFGNLCPRADICNRNSSEPKVLANGINGKGNTSSCCQGCSCHERCYENMDCCFPSDEHDISDEESKISVMDCIYARTGTPDESWPRNVPAYRIVSSAPKGGCVDNFFSETSKRNRLFPSCNKDPVTSWGNLFPVYSNEHDKIYKNAECALCHNTTNVTPWFPELVCNETSSRGKMTLSQNVQFLQRNLKTSYCFIAFHFSEPSILENKRCYHELVSTCKEPPHVNTIAALTFTNLSSSNIRKACASGLKSPVRIYPNTYRNIYCFLCNVNLWTMHKYKSCTLTEKKRVTIPGTYSVLLDAVFFKKMNHNGVSIEQIALPEACVGNGQLMTSGRCREILCPSGQMQTRTGCKVPIKSWFVDSVCIMLRLNYQDSQDDTILTMVQQGEVKRTDMKQRFLEKNPWPSLWKIVSIAHTDDACPGKKSIVIFIESKTKSPAILFRCILNSMRKQWTVSLNGSSIDFEQTFFKKTKTDENGNWHVFHDERKGIPSRRLSKLFVCEQVVLYSGDFNLTEENTVLSSDLTTRILYDMEFELVYDVNTTVTVRVCLSDTVFKTKQETNGSRKVQLAELMVSSLFEFCLWHLAKVLVFNL